MTLSDLRAGLQISTPALAKALGLSRVALAALEATLIQRASVGAVARYVNALGARLEVVFADGQRLEVKP
jgi:hypothetical protein